ncbi:hypothetical protein [Pontibacter sp. G13]|uniref:hypothetical protein n=1 Tax=Pontibacter sp. G13 TaxID=3074898 RepID=UPI00288AA52B|nr:hypothetical protein [Pontibacter sp. G13]WNJ20962.1 hypothetical protein RJD25_10840 [Pontibacter sp. G13]
MKKNLTAFLLVFTMFGGFAFAQSFEGTITTEIAFNPAKNSVLSIQGNQAFFHRDQVKVDFLTNLDDQTLTRITYYPQQTEVAISTLGSGRSAGSQFNDVIETTDTQEIDGYTCTKVLATFNQVTYTAWVAKDLAHLNIEAFIPEQTFGSVAHTLYIPGVSGVVLELEADLEIQGNPYHIRNRVKEAPVAGDVFELPADARVIRQ